MIRQTGCLSSSLHSVLMEYIRHFTFYYYGLVVPNATLFHSLHKQVKHSLCQLFVHCPGFVISGCSRNTCYFQLISTFCDGHKPSSLDFEPISLVWNLFNLILCHRWQHFILQQLLFAVVTVIQQTIFLLNYHLML